MKTKKQVQALEGKKKLNSKELRQIWGGPDGTPPPGGGG